MNEPNEAAPGSDSIAPPGWAEKPAETAQESRLAPALRSGRPPRRLIGVALALAVAGALVIVFATAGSGQSFQARAQSICKAASASFKQRFKTPDSIGQALQLEHALVNTFSNEITELRRLTPPVAAATRFRAALSDEASLAGMLRSMLANPDYVQLAITLPGHPNREPAWLKSWIARSHALAADAQARFAALHITACTVGS